MTTKAQRAKRQAEKKKIEINGAAVKETFDKIVKETLDKIYRAEGEAVTRELAERRLREKK